MTFRVGQKVVCIEGSEPDEPCPHVQKGAVYTVAEIFEAGDGANLNFVEVSWSGDEQYFAGFRAENFRPAVEPKTDISIFHRILDEVNRTQKVTA